MSDCKRSLFLLGGFMKLEKRKVEDLIPYENNAKLHPRYQIEEIKESIKQFGFCDPNGIAINSFSNIFLNSFLIIIHVIRLIYIWKKSSIS